MAVLRFAARTSHGGVVPHDVGRGGRQMRCRVRRHRSTPLLILQLGVVYPDNDGPTFCVLDDEDELVHALPMATPWGKGLLPLADKRKLWITLANNFLGTRATHNPCI